MAFMGGHVERGPEPRDGVTGHAARTVRIMDGGSPGYDPVRFMAPGRPCKLSAPAPPSRSLGAAFRPYARRR